MRAIVTAAVIMAAFIFGSASPTFAGDKDKGGKSLYKRLGGKKAIAAVVDDFVNNCANDARINKFFAQAANDPERMAKFKRLLNDQICEASGGPCKYRGLTMPVAHANMNLTDEHFGALVEDLIKTLDKFKVPEKEKGELLGALGPLKDQIVGK